MNLSLSEKTYKSSQWLAVGYPTFQCINHHITSYEPIIDHQNVEKSYHGRPKIIEIHQVVKSWDLWVLSNNLSLCYQASIAGLSY